MIKPAATAVWEALRARYNRAVYVVFPYELTLTGLLAGFVHQGFAALVVPFSLILVWETRAGIRCPRCEVPIYKLGVGFADSCSECAYPDDDSRGEDLVGDANDQG